jgi:phenylacetate-CoA ligase
MNLFYNPVFFSKVAKSYLFDLPRLTIIDNTKLRKYQNKQIRKMVKYAYFAPMYHDIYKKVGFYPDDIKSIDDLSKLPTVSKLDFKKYYPDGLISSTVKKNKLLEITTSGTTGKSLSLYVDMFDIIKGLFGYLRSIKEHGLNWRKDKITVIADFAPHTIETGYMKKGLSSIIGSGFLRNWQWLNTNDPPEKVANEIDNFNPDFIGGYTGMLGHLSLLKEKGICKNVNPKVIASTGAPLNKSLKNLIEQTFNAPVFEFYAATESGPIAFQCKNGKYHIMSDLVYLEFLKNGELVKSKEAGKLIVTKLFGKGTPIIRYESINDIVAPLYEVCDCGMAGGLIYRIYGRDDISIYTPDGRMLLPASFGEIFSKVLYELKTTKLKDVRTIQHSLTKIEIQVVIDEKQKDIGPSVEDIFTLLKKGFKEKIGSNVDFVTKEVKEIDKKKPRIISKINPSKIQIIGYD